MAVDLPTDTRDAIVKAGTVRKNLYCPVYTDQDVDGLWDYTPTLRPRDTSS